MPCSLLFSPVSFAPFLTPLPHPVCLALCTDRKRRSPHTTWAGLGPSPHRSACARRRDPRLAARTAPNRTAPRAPRAQAGLYELACRALTAPDPLSAPAAGTLRSRLARTGPAGPALPHAEAGSRDPAWWGRGGDVIRCIAAPGRALTRCQPRCHSGGGGSCTDIPRLSLARCFS